jgi:hypothetical protein
LLNFFSNLKAEVLDELFYLLVCKKSRTFIGTCMENKRIPKDDIRPVKALSLLVFGEKK